MFQLNLDGRVTGWVHAKECQESKTQPWFCFALGAQKIFCGVLDVPCRKRSLTSRLADSIIATLHLRRNIDSGMIRSIWIWQWTFTQESSFPLIDGLVKTQAVRPSEVKPKVHHLKWFCPSRGASFWGIITKMALFQILSSWVICHLPGSFACFCLPTVFSISDRCWTTCTCHEGCLDAWFGIGTRQHWWRDMESLRRYRYNIPT